MKYVYITKDSYWNSRMFIFCYYSIISLYFVLWIIFKFSFYSILGYAYIYSSWYLRFLDKNSKKLTLMNFFNLIGLTILGFILQIFFWLFFFMYLLSYLKYKKLKKKSNTKYQKKTFCNYSLEFFNWKKQDQFGRPVKFSYHFFSFLKLCLKKY